MRSSVTIVPTSSITDRRSVKGQARRGRPSVPVVRLLEAADALFAGSATPMNVTMDAIAIAANVGKGTLFRAFGSRDALLDALWKSKLSALRDAVEGEDVPLGTGTPPFARAVAFLDAVLSFKLANRHLLHAREMAPGLLHSEHYRWMHRSLRLMIADAGSPELKASYAAHVLLAGLHVGLVDELLTGGGLTLEALRQAQAEHVQAVVADAAR